MILALVFPSLVGCQPRISERDLVDISLPEVRRLADRAAQDPTGARVRIVDPRQPSKFAEGHIPGALNVQISAIVVGGRTDPRLARADRIIVYGDDPASAVARGMAIRLMSASYDGVRLFRGGLKDWNAAGLPLELVETVEDTDSAGAGAN